MSSKTGNSFSNWPSSAEWPMSMVKKTIEQVMGDVQRKVGVRVGRGDVRLAILLLLAEGDMHGYQLMSEIEKRSSGAWKPSPGSVYPTLQLLLDEGLVSAHESEGRKTYSLSDAGRAAAEAEQATGKPAPWKLDRDLPEGSQISLAKAGADLAASAAAVARKGDKHQIAKAVEILDESQRALYRLLSND